MFVCDTRHLYGQMYPDTPVGIPSMVPVGALQYECNRFNLSRSHLHRHIALKWVRMKSTTNSTRNECHR